MTVALDQDKKKKIRNSQDKIKEKPSSASRAGEINPL